MSSRTRERLEEALFPPVIALLVALICGDLLIMSYGQSPATVYRLLLEGNMGNAYGFGQVLYKATTLTVPDSPSHLAFARDCSTSELKPARGWAIHGRCRRAALSPGVRGRLRFFCLLAAAFGVWVVGAVPDISR